MSTSDNDSKFASASTYSYMYNPDVSYITWSLSVGLPSQHWVINNMINVRIAWMSIDGPAEPRPSLIPLPVIGVTPPPQVTQLEQT